jgi:hypothetical protein
MFKKVFGTANKYIENIFNKDSNDSNSNDISLINELPDEILEQIFLRLSAIDLTKKVNLVCKKWNFLIKNNEFWIQKSIHDKKLTKQKLQLLNERQIGWNAKKNYFNNIFSRNLLKNGSAENTFDNWYFCGNKNIENLNIENLVLKCKQESVKKSGPNNFKTEWAKCKDGWSIEKHKINLLDNNKEMCVFVTSYFLSTKMQCIDLWDEGVDEETFNQLMLDIEISELYSARANMGCEYKLKVYLLSKDFQLVDSFFHDETIHDPVPDLNWKLIKHKFDSRSFKKDVRYILYSHSGKVSLFLACNIWPFIPSISERFLNFNYRSCQHLLSSLS